MELLFLPPLSVGFEGSGIGAVTSLSATTESVESSAGMPRFRGNASRTFAEGTASDWRSRLDLLMDSEVLGCKGKGRAGRRGRQFSDFANEREESTLAEEWGGECTPVVVTALSILGLFERLALILSGVVSMCSSSVIRGENGVQLTLVWDNFGSLFLCLVGDPTSFCREEDTVCKEGISDMVVTRRAQVCRRQSDHRIV